MHSLKKIPFLSVAFVASAVALPAFAQKADDAAGLVSCFKQLADYQDYCKNGSDCSKTSRKQGAFSFRSGGKLYVIDEARGVLSADVPADGGDDMAVIAKVGSGPGAKNFVVTYNRDSKVYDHDSGFVYDESSWGGSPDSGQEIGAIRKWRLGFFSYASAPTAKTVS